MQSGAFPVDAPVLDIRTTVLVGGVERPYENLSWDAEITGDLPDSVAAGAGVRERTGSVTWAAQPVSTLLGGPWSRSMGWPPARGDRVEIWDHCNGVSWRRFYGRIDGNSGGLGEPITSTIVDDWDALDREAYVPTMFQSAPGRRYSAMGVGQGYLASMTPWGQVYRALESAGHGLVPPHGGAVLAASFQGAATPWAGGVDSVGGQLKTSSEHRGVQYAPAMTFGENWYEGYAPKSLTSLSVLFRYPWEDVHVAEAATASAEISVASGSAVKITASATAVTVALNGATVGSVSRERVPGTLATVGVRWAGTDLRIDVDGVRHDLTATAASPTTRELMTATVSRLSAIQVHADQTASAWHQRIASVPAAPPYEFTVSSWSFLVAPATRMIVNKSARDVLAEFSRATLHAVWLDEDGRLQIKGSDRLTRSGIDREFTTSMHVFDMQWRESWSHLRHAAKVNYLESSIVQMPFWSVTVWQPSSPTQLSAGESDVQFIEPAPDEDWLEPDFTMDNASQFKTELNWGRGSMYSATATTIGSNANESWASSWLYVSVGDVQGYTKKLTQTARSDLAAGLVLNTKTPDNDTELIPRWRDAPMPLIRARGGVQWREDSVTTAGGPSWASEYTHEMGHWGSSAAAQMLSAWLAEQIVKDEPLPIVEGVEVAYDPRTQLGDMVRVTSTYGGFSLTGLVVGIGVEVSEGHSMRLTIRITEMTDTVTTYAELEAAYAGVGENYSTLENDWSGETYADFETDPAGRQ